MNAMSAWNWKQIENRLFSSKMVSLKEDQELKAFFESIWKFWKPLNG